MLILPCHCKTPINGELPFHSSHLPLSASSRSPKVASGPARAFGLRAFISLHDESMDALELHSAARTLRLILASKFSVPKGDLLVPDLQALQLCRSRGLPGPAFPVPTGRPRPRYYCPQSRIVHRPYLGVCPPLACS